MSKPDCYKCIHRKSIPGDCHSTCINIKAKVEGNPHGIKSGWFAWPFNFDPVWLISCNGFSDNPKNKIKLDKESSSLLSIFGILGGRLI